MWLSVFGILFCWVKFFFSLLLDSRPFQRHQSVSIGGSALWPIFTDTYRTDTYTHAHTFTQCVYARKMSWLFGRLVYDQRIQNQNSITTQRKKSFMHGNNFRKERRERAHHRPKTKTNQKNSDQKKKSERNCRYKMPILNFISITIRNTRLYRPLQSKIWTFTVYIHRKNEKRTEKREKKTFTKNFFHSKSGAHIQPDPITLCFMLFSVAFFSDSIMNGSTEESNTQKSVVKMKFIV